ncbi:unnamed protein product [Spirodela intermedia]|uniref:Protein kinase domain-containing protein n=1 Tax=Spirodela intermedia TaxID=51605 RepID=A0A7I8I8Z1_SPIIN|nr:unnamed protein product [Spirodela intermedia]CAA6654125.1 unnamed protein product [Spirodela intermedia]
MARTEPSVAPARQPSQVAADVQPAGHHHRHRILSASSPTFMTILIPLISVAALVALALALLLLLRRLRSSRQTHGAASSACGSAVSRGNDIHKRQHSGLGVGHSPDVKRSIYGGTMGFPFQPKYRGGQVFTYRELELATEGFKEQNGTLPDGTVAAIKMLNRQGKQGEREFRVEVDLLSRLHSPHLVGLLGYCADQHHRLLVFEYMPNGSLQCHLHLTTRNGQNRALDWGTRLRVALDCARALEFLHEHTVPAVIHRDFKCSNILLDHNYRAKVSDFGMAKIGSDKINGQVLTRVLGTTGYVAPEYALSGKLTTKSDVYSFGVVLLELLTGRVPVDVKRPPGEDVLVPWALPKLTNREKLMEMVDPTLEGQCSKKEMIQIAAIAAVCVQSEADYRPLMTDVVQSLIPLVRTQSGTCPTTPSRFQHPLASLLP